MVRTSSSGFLRAILVAACSALALGGAADRALAANEYSTKIGTEVRLSDERTMTRWATPLKTARVYVTASAQARTIAKLRLLTEDRMPEVYVALSLATNTEGDWLRVRIPGRPNGRSGWVRRAAFGDLVRNEYRLEINRRSFHIRLFRAGRQIFRARVGVGTAQTPTPAGQFWIREKLRFRSNPSYGNYAFGTSAYAPTLSEWPGGGVVGIHGTEFPSLIPGRPSHGCIRMRNASVAKLWQMTPLGTPVQIR
ncbi:unannotated protein [freshwater metagenome]|uniref:Unannotated protein n=1 Tax=freshwater metagenome TaxID=449393 RepID=A0A6J5Z3A6_9ZZZZ|nr:L,D-transpeptidase family protein [Actinomycetota bacterium]